MGRPAGAAVARGYRTPLQKLHAAWGGAQTRGEKQAGGESWQAGKAGRWEKQAGGINYKGLRRRTAAGLSRGEGCRDQGQPEKLAPFLTGSVAEDSGCGR